MKDRLYDVAIVGGGIAGYSAALTAKNLKLDYLWLGDKNFGKKTERAEFVRNYPAFSGEGKAFVRALEKQRAEEGILLCEKRIDGVYKEKGKFTLTAGQENFFACAVVLATGVELSFGIGEEFVGRGVSYCAVCDGALYKNKKVAAVLYDKEELHEAEYLASFASEALLFSKEPVVAKANNIRLIKEVPKSVSGTLRVEKITTDKNEYAIDGVFLLGRSAPPSVLCGGLKTEGAHIQTGRDLATNIEGVFAAGDVAGKPYQFIKAAGDGCVAAYSVKAYLNREK